MNRRFLPSGAILRLAILFALFLPPGRQAAGGDVGSGVLHLVLFKFLDDAAPAAVRRVVDEFGRLPARIPGIRGFQWGTNNSPEKLDRGFTHGFIVGFESVAARDAYLTHEAHEAFVALAKPSVENVFVLDFAADAAALAAEPGRVHHLVFFKFKPEAGEESLVKVQEAFAALPRKVPGLLGYRAGRDVSTEGRAADFTHGHLLTFVNERARDDYLPHPAHRDFGTLVRPLLAEVLVVDFTVAPSAQALFVTDGLEPYGVYQRGPDGTAALRFSGIALDGPIEARVLAGRRVLPGFDWKVAGKAGTGRFEAAIPGVPAGGEYTVEVRQRDALGNVAAHTEVANLLVGDVWILAGQSNMEGHGDLIDVEEPSSRVHCFTMAHRWELAVEPLHWLIDSPDPVHSGGALQGLDEDGRREKRAAARAGRRKGAGLGLAFARELARRTGVPIGLVAAAHGGTSMEQWDPEGRERGGEMLYGSMWKQARNAGGKARGVLWYQGESDANPQAAAVYAARLRTLVEAFRRDFQAPELPFYYVQIGRFVVDQPPAAWNRVQELQRLAEGEIPGTAMVPVIDLELDDLIHVGTQGLRRAGRRLAKVAHAKLFGGAAAGLKLGPRLAGVETLGDGRTIRVRFGEVNGRLLPEGKVEGFSVRKRDGTLVPIIYSAAVDPRDPSSVLLRLQNPVPEDGVLHYGWGLNPTCNLVDAEDMAAPVFGPAEIKRGA